MAKANPFPAVKFGPGCGKMLAIQLWDECLREIEYDYFTASREQVRRILAGEQKYFVSEYARFYKPPRFASRNPQDRRHYPVTFLPRGRIRIGCAILWAFQVQIIRKWAKSG